MYKVLLQTKTIFQLALLNSLLSLPRAITSFISLATQKIALDVSDNKKTMNDEVYK